jgi:hypothetical protein
LLTIISGNFFVAAKDPFIFYFNLIFSYQRQPKSRCCLPSLAATFLLALMTLSFFIFIWSFPISGNQEVVAVYIISGNFFVAANDPFIFLFLFGLFLLAATFGSPLFILISSDYIMSPLFTIISGNFFVAANDPFIFLF